jgi:hypothetical protein
LKKNRVNVYVPKKKSEDASMGATMKDFARLAGAVEARVPSGIRGQALTIGGGIAV